jgi:hypothetical protein
MNFSLDRLSTLRGICAKDHGASNSATGLEGAVAGTTSSLKTSFETTALDDPGIIIPQVVTGIPKLMNGGLNCGSSETRTIITTVITRITDKPVYHFTTK